MNKINYPGYCPFVNQTVYITVSLHDAVYEFVKGTYYCEHKATGRCPYKCPIYEELPGSFKK